MNEELNNNINTEISNTTQKNAEEPDISQDAAIEVVDIAVDSPKKDTSINSSTDKYNLPKLDTEELIKKSKEWIDKSITEDVIKESSLTLQNIITSIVYSPTDVVCSLISLIRNTKNKTNLLLSWIVFNIVIVIFNVLVYVLVSDFEIYSHIYGCIISTLVFLVLYLIKKPKITNVRATLPTENNLNEFEESIPDDAETCWFEINTFTSSDDEEEY